MIEPIFSYSAYKTYLLHRIKNAPKGGHGMRNRLATAMGCQAAYVSHVLGGSRDLSIEQAEAAARFFALDADETEYLVWLVGHERAGTPSARRFYARLLERKRTEHLQLKKRVDIESELTDTDKSVYYSSYLYGAIHMLVTVPEFRTQEAIAARLALPPARINEVLGFLKRSGLVVDLGGRLEPGSRLLFVDKSSPFIVQHHANWRIHALSSIARKSPDDLHLSMTVTLSENDAKALRARMASFIEEISTTVKASKEEKLMNINLDFFDV